jgi:hypothetical protein
MVGINICVTTIRCDNSIEVRDEPQEEARYMVPVQ